MNRLVTVFVILILAVLQITESSPAVSKYMYDDWNYEIDDQLNTAPPQQNKKNGNEFEETLYFEEQDGNEEFAEDNLQFDKKGQKNEKQNKPLKDKGNEHGQQPFTPDVYNDTILYGTGPDIIEGDIKVTPEQAALFKEGGWDSLLKSEAWNIARSRTWSRTIPYSIHSSVHPYVRNSINYSIGLFHKHTCLRFVRRRSYHNNYIHFVNRGGCWSYIGRQNGQQLVSLSRGCYGAIPAHELLHALGRYHEQSRPDRNAFVTVNTTNIIRRYKHNFKTVANADVQSIPYDYGSVMHYGAYAFSRNRLPTILPQQIGVLLGQRGTISPSDALHINIRYCPERAVRLVGRNRGTHEGRVEVFWNGQWGTVCDDWFSTQDGRTICRYLGFPGVRRVTTGASVYGQGNGPIWFDNMRCQGNEHSPFSCRKNPIGNHNCGHREDSGVKCQKNIRLVGSKKRGRVEVYFEGRWGTICDQSFDMKDAMVVCRQLGGYQARGFYIAGGGSGPIWLSGLECNGGEAQVGYCSINEPLGQVNTGVCDHARDIGVHCN